MNADKLAQGFDFTAEEVNECFDGLFEGGPRLVPVEIFEQMRACCLANAADNDTQPAQAAQTIQDMLDAGDPDWRKKLRPNLTGDEALRFAVRDIAEERRMLADEITTLRAAQPVGVTADLLRRIDVLCPSEGSYLSRMEWKAAKLNRMLAAAPQPPAQPSVIAPSVQTLPLKSAPYEMTTTAQPSADAEDAARYRWLRPRLLTADFEYGDDSETVLVFLIPTTMAVSANLDKSIDAAGAAEGDGHSLHPAAPESGAPTPAKG